MPRQHPLSADAIATLIRLHNAAVDRADRLQRRLDTDDDLPRGPLPLMAKISEHTTEATHLRIALEAMGYSEASERRAA